MRPIQDLENLLKSVKTYSTKGHTVYYVKEKDLKTAYDAIKEGTHLLKKGNTYILEASDGIVEVYIAGKDEPFSENKAIKTGTGTTPVEIPTLDEVLSKDNYGKHPLTLLGNKGYVAGRLGVTIFSIGGASFIENGDGSHVIGGIAIGSNYSQIWSGGSSSAPEASLFIDSRRGIAEINTRFQGKDAEADTDYVTLKQVKSYTLEDSTNAGNHTQVGVGITGEEGDPPTDGVYITHNASGVTAIQHYRGGAIEAGILITSENSEVGSGIELMAGGDSFVMREQAKFSTPVQGEDAVKDNDFVTKGQMESVISQVVIDDTSEEALTKEQLNTTYPNLNIGSQVYVPQVELMYTKISADSWASISFHPVE